MEDSLQVIRSSLLEPLNVGREETLLKGELEESSQPWLQLQEHVNTLNNRLSQLFTQLLQLFGNNSGSFAAVFVVLA